MPDQYILVPLPHGLFTIIDADDADRVLPYRWFVSGGYVRRNHNGPRPRSTILLHRVIIDAPRGSHVDHINRDKLDNRRRNLRFATKVENGRNRGRNVNNTSGFKGVTWSRKCQRWQAQIGGNGKVRFLGYFDTAEDAARAYNEVARDNFGEFAFLNEV